MIEALQNKITKFFEGLTFVEETHKYSLNGVEFKMSVSGVVEKFIKHVDYRILALKKDVKLGLPMGTTMKLWDYNADVAKAIGTEAHYFGEMYTFHRKLEPTNGYQEAVVKFWKELPEHIVPIFVELQMYHKRFMFPGMKDITLLNLKTGKIIIADYKTNRDLWKRFQFKKLLPPFERFLDTAFNHYQIQLSLYQILLEQVPGVEVERRVIVELNPEGHYNMYDTEDLTEPLNIWLEHNPVC